jgi:hypothetical protein
VRFEPTNSYEKSIPIAFDLARQPCKLDEACEASGGGATIEVEASWKKITLHRFSEPKEVYRKAGSQRRN